MLLIGYPSNIEGLIVAGWVFFLAGVELQILLLFKEKIKGNRSRAKRTNNKTPA